MLGYGELTLVFGWPPERPEFAVKRLPPFRDVAQLHRYGDLLDRYTTALRDRGVRLVPTELRVTEATGAGPPRAYLVQPLVPREHHPQRAAAEGHAGDGRRAAGHPGRAGRDGRRPELGLDAQASNWAVEDGGLACFDLSTPLMRSPEGQHRLDLSLFLSIYLALRGVLRPVAHGVMAQYHDPRTVLLDVASNLVKERLDRWLPAFLGAAAARVSPPIEEGEVRRYFARDKKLWLLMQRLRRTDRAWQRSVRRRPYPSCRLRPTSTDPRSYPRARPDDRRERPFDLGASAEAFDLIARHLSPHKAEAFRALGIDLVQGRREGVRSGTSTAATTSTAAARAGCSTSAPPRIRRRGADGRRARARHG